MRPMLEARNLSKVFEWRQTWGKRRRLVAVDGVDLVVQRGECLALVGESGSGKTTLGRCLLRLIEPESGELWFNGEDLLALSGSEMRQRRKRMQMIFQDSAGALNPRMEVGELLAEPIKIHDLVPKPEIPARVTSLLGTVGLSGALSNRFPHQLSGGQRQRVAIARALATEPQLLVLDEPVSALDVSVRAQVLTLLSQLRSEFDLTMVLIAHDLAMVSQIAERVAVMYLGRIIEAGTSPEVFSAPQHPYTTSLLSAVPPPDPTLRTRRRLIPEEIPSPLDPPSGCSFHPRCPRARLSSESDRRLCVEETPRLSDVSERQTAACHFPESLDDRSRERSLPTER